MRRYGNLQVGSVFGGFSSQNGSFRFQKKKIFWMENRKLVFKKSVFALTKQNLMLKIGEKNV